MPFEPLLPDPLNEIERSIEDTFSSEINAYADPLSHMLDAVENSIVPNRSLSPFMPDPLHEVLDFLEAEIEKQIIPGLKPEILGDDENITPQMKAIGPMSKLPVPDSGGLSFNREYPHPNRRTGGSGTGIRNSGGGSECYCYLHEGWVQAEDCRSCADFEQAENQTDGEEDCCRHSSDYVDDV